MCVQAQKSGYVLPNVEAITPGYLLPIQDMYCQSLKTSTHDMQNKNMSFLEQNIQKTRHLTTVLCVAHRCRYRGPACRASLSCRCTQRSQSCCGNCTRGTCTRASRRRTRQYLQKGEEPFLFSGIDSWPAVLRRRR